MVECIRVGAIHVKGLKYANLYACEAALSVYPPKSYNFRFSITFICICYRFVQDSANWLMWNEEPVVCGNGTGTRLVYFRLHLVIHLDFTQQPLEGMG